MASTDARPVARKNVAFRVYFQINDISGDPVAGAASLDSEISKDGGAFADCTNEATEVAQGVYHLDLTSTEMNADSVVVKVKSDQKPTMIFIYPEEEGDYRIDPTTVRDSILSDSTAFAGADIAAILTDTGTTIPGLINGQNDLSAAEVNAEVDTALTDIGLDHLLSASVAGADVTDDSVVAQLVSKSATADWDDFDNTTDSMQALRDHIGDGTNLTEAGGTGDHLTALRLSSTGVDDILDETYEGTTTFRQFLRVAAAALFGKASGLGGTTATYRDEADSTDRITAVVDADGNRTSVTLDKS